MKLFELDSALRHATIRENFDDDAISAVRTLINKAPTADDVVAELPDLIAQYDKHPLMGEIKEIMANFSDASEITLMVDDVTAIYEMDLDEKNFQGDRFNEAKLPDNVVDVRKRLRDAGFDVPYTDRTKTGVSLKIPGPRALAMNKETDSPEVKQALKKAQALVKQVESVVGDDGEVRLSKFYDLRGPGWQFNVRVIPHSNLGEADYEGGIDFEPQPEYAGVKGVTTATGPGEKQAKDAEHKLQGEKVNAHWVKLLKAVKSMPADNPKRKELVQNLKKMAATAEKQGFELSPPAQKVFGLQAN